MSHNTRTILRKSNSTDSFFSISVKGLSRMFPLYIFVLAVACSKVPVDIPKPPQPVENKTEQIDLGNRVIPFWGRIETIDFDKDNFPELIFEIVPIGDPILKRDRWLWQTKSTRFTALLINPHTEQVPALTKGDSIRLNDFDGYEWHYGAQISLFEKIMDVQGNTWWEGDWKGVSNKYLPFKVLRADGYYAGWVQISSDLVKGQGYLHRAGISKVPNKPVKAGY